MIPNKLNIAVALMLVLGACGKKHDTPIPTPTVHTYMNKMAGQYVMTGQYVYQCWLCAMPTYVTTYIERGIKVYVMDDTTISLMDTSSAGNAKVMYLQSYDTTVRSLYFVSPDNGMYGHSFVEYYIARDSIVYDDYSRTSGSSREDILHTP